MTWTRLDDRWDYGSKLIRAGSMLRSDAPALVWARAVTHCNRELTDGRIHGAVLRSFTFDRRPQRVIDALVIVGAPAPRAPSMPISNRERSKSWRKTLRC